MSARTVTETARLLPSPALARLPAPAYAGPRDDQRPRVGLALEAMKRHTSSEGWDLFAGLERAGYVLHGHGIGDGLTDVREILTRERPGTVLMQDAREWMGETADRSLSPLARFQHVRALRESGAFVGTILKDAHQRPEFHRQSADEIGCHFWVCYYAPQIVCRLAPYLRREHLIRTWHTLDASLVPDYSPDGRRGCLLSGAISGAYPLRQALVAGRRHLPEMDVLPHPGYRADRCRTPEYLLTLSRYKVAICTSSRYGYALRKLMEATACGCVVITDLPADEFVPEIDASLVRIHPETTPHRVGQIVRELLDKHDPVRQAEFARRAVAYYDYRTMGLRLAQDIENLRRTYKGD